VAWDSPQNIETYEFLKSLIPYLPPGYAEAGWSELLSNYYTGATAMTRYAGRLLSNTKEFNEEIYGVTKCCREPTPNGRPEEQIGLAEVAGIGIWKATADVEVAKDFSHSFVTGDNYLDWVHTVVPHYLPPRKSVMNDPKYWEHPILQEKRESLEIMLDALETGVNWNCEHGTFNPDANAIVSTTLIPDCVQDIMIRDVPVKKAMQDTAQKMRELIGQA